MKIGIIAFIISCAFSNNVIHLKAINVLDLEKIFQYAGATSSIVFYDGEIWISGKHYIYNIDKQGNLINQFGEGDKNKFRRSLAMDVDEKFIITKELHNGRNFILLINKNGEIIRKPKEHHYRSIFGIKILNNSSIIILGQYFTKYSEWLDRYDENSINTSKVSINKFRDFFVTQTAYTLTKYDLNLSILDSSNFIKRDGENIEGFTDLYLHEIMAIDKLNNIFTIHKSDNYLIRKYSSNFELLFEFEGHNDHFKPIPDKLTKAKAKRMRNVPGTFSNIYSIIVINDTIITSFYQNPKNWDIPSSPFYFDVFNQEGEKLHTGTIPYRIFTKDNENNLYFMVKKEGGWFLGKDQYYLVSFTLNDLMNCSINEEWVDITIQEYLDEK